MNNFKGKIFVAIASNEILLRTVGTHLSTSPSDQGLAQDTVTHHSEVSTPQDTQQFYRIVPQDHPQQHCHPTKDQSSKDFHQFHNAARKDYQHFDTVQESQELRHFQQSQDQNGQSQDYQGVETVHHPAQRTQESGDLRQELARGLGGDLHQEVAREVGGDHHQEVGRGVGQDPQQFRMQLEEMIAARQENEQRTDFRKEVDWAKTNKQTNKHHVTALLILLKRTLTSSLATFDFSHPNTVSEQSLWIAIKVYNSTLNTTETKSQIKNKQHNACPVKNVCP